MAETEKFLRLDVSWARRPDDRTPIFIEQIQDFLSELEKFDSRFGGLSWSVGNKMKKNSPDFRTIAVEKATARAQKARWIFSICNQCHDPYYSLFVANGIYLWPDISERPWPAVTGLEFGAAQEHGIWADEKWVLDFMQLWIDYWNPVEVAVYDVNYGTSSEFDELEIMNAGLSCSSFWMRWFRDGGDWHWQDNGQSVGPPATVRRFLDGKLHLWPHFAPTEPSFVTIADLVSRRLNPEETISEFG